jgi:hypothetical protein
MSDRREQIREARTRALSARRASPLEPPAWATKAREEASWRRAALILAHDILKITVAQRRA